MSQIVTRKGPVGEDKEKGPSNETPVKEMKKKMAANAEKEKQAAEKHAERDREKEREKAAEAKQTEKAEKNVEKNPEKKEKFEKNVEKNPEKKEKSEKNAEKNSEKKDKSDKNLDKSSEKKEKSEKGTEKKEKPEKGSEKREKQTEKEKLDKSVDKSADKKTEAPAEKPKEDKNAKQEKPEDKDKDKDTEKRERDKKPADTPKPKVNGSRANGDHGGPGVDSDGTVSSDEELVITDHERDDMFPELAYDDSDGEFEPPTPEGLPSRSYTRRSQAKATRTPETPRPASERRGDRDPPPDDSKESKVLKLKEDTPITDRKLRSSDSPKPESKKTEKKAGEKEKETGKEIDATRTGDKPSAKKNDLEVPELNYEGRDEMPLEVILDVDMDVCLWPAEGAGGSGGAGLAAVKDGTNYSRSRVKVSPYRRLADQTTSSVTANYTGNNTTMEMDITESSLVEEVEGAASPYLSGLRAIRGRRSYKPLKEMALRNVGVTRSVRSATGVGVTEAPSRPTAPVVGRKRKPEGDDSVELGTEAHETHEAQVVRGKRARLLEKLARPFRGAASTPLPVRRNAEIVGINTDLPLTAPVASPDTFDPETLKTSPAADPAAPLAPAPAPAPGQRDRDGKRCSVM